MSTVVAAGFFDGVHLGHRRILHGADVALTFKNHPLSVLKPGSEPSLIMSYGAKESAIKGCGVGKVIAIEFTKELSQVSAEDILVFFEGCSKIRCGADWRFGKEAKGDADFLRAHGFDVEVVSYVEVDGERVSSSCIRSALDSGDIIRANRMLGRAWSVEGLVVSGKGVGTKIGFPTVNMQLASEIQQIPSGVYEVSACGCRAIANFGYAPTMGLDAWRSKVLELHFKDLPDDLPKSGYCKVEFIDFIRPERKFNSIDELKRAIADDCKKVFGV